MVDECQWRQSWPDGVTDSDLGHLPDIDYRFIGIGSVTADWPWHDTADLGLPTSLDCADYLSADMWLSRLLILSRRLRLHASGAARLITEGLFSKVSITDSCRLRCGSRCINAMNDMYNCGLNVVITLQQMIVSICGSVKIQPLKVTDWAEWHQHSCRRLGMTATRRWKKQ